MSLPEQSSVRNRLLSAIPPESFAALRPHMRIIPLPLKHALVESGAPTREVCFLEIGLAAA